MPYNRTLLEDLNQDIVRVLLPAIVYLGVLMVVGAVGNFLTIYVYGWRLKSTAQNCLFMWLGVFDLVSCVVGMPSEIVDIRRYYLYEDALACKIMRFLLTIPSVASANLLIVIAVDRYRRVCKPLHSQMEVRHARLGVGAAGLVALTLAAPALSLYGRRTVKTSVDGLSGCDCSVQDQYLGRLYPLLYELLFGAFFLLYTVILAVLYARVWLVTRRHHAYMAAHAAPPMAYSSLLDVNDPAAGNAWWRTSGVGPGGNADVVAKIRQSLKANKLTVIAFAVTVVFVLSYLPHLVLIIIRSVVEGFDHRQTGARLVLFNIFLRSFFVNSVANVFVYSAMNADFREQCRRLCPCGRGGGKSNKPRLQDSQRPEDGEGSGEPV